MPTPLQLPATIAAYFEADTGPGHALADCFTPDAVVQDEGHTYHGQAEIRAWRADVATKFTYKCEPLAVEQAADTTIVACKLTGNFPGSPIDLRFHFQLAGDKIRTLHIRP